MVVFYCIVILTVLYLIIVFSKISILFEKIEIKSIEELKNIYLAIENEDYQQILKYIEFKVRIKLKLFFIINITIIKIDSRSIYNLIDRINERVYNDKEKNYKRYIEKREAQKRKINRVMNNFYKNIKVELIDLLVDLGLKNAEITAIIVGTINAITSILIATLFESKNKMFNINYNKNKVIKKDRHIKYKFQPRYTEDFYFYLKSKVIISARIRFILFQK